MLHVCCLLLSSNARLCSTIAPASKVRCCYWSYWSTPASRIFVILSINRPLDFHGLILPSFHDCAAAGTLGFSSMVGGMWRMRADQKGSDVQIKVRARSHQKPACMQIMAAPHAQDRSSCVCSSLA